MVKCPSVKTAAVNEWHKQEVRGGIKASDSSQLVMQLSQKKGSRRHYTKLIAELLFA